MVWLLVLLAGSGASCGAASPVAVKPVAATPDAATPDAALTAAAIARRTPRPRQWQRVPVDVTRLFDVAELARWRDHRGRQRRLAFFALALDLLCYALLLGGLGRRLYAAAERTTRRWSAGWSARWPERAGGLAALARRLLGADWAAALLFAAAYFAIGVALDVPFGLYSEHLSREIGLSTSSAALWWRDTLVALLLGALAFAALVVGVFGLVRRFPRGWWALLAAPVALGLFASTLLSPYGTRIYQRLVPLAQSRFAGRSGLETRLRALARASGVELSRVLVMDGSRRSRALNAYVSGVGPTRELVLFDTLLTAATDREVAVVLAHELAHLDEPLSATARTALAAAALVLFLALLAQLLRWGARRRGWDDPGDVRLLPLVGLATIVLFNVALPARNALSRQREEAADRRALVLTADPAAFISLQTKLVRRNRLDPAPPRWVRWWLASHPPAVERIGLATWYGRWLLRRGAITPAATRQRLGSPPMLRNALPVAPSKTCKARECCK